MPSCNMRITGSIFSGTPQRARTTHNRSRSTESHALQRSITRMNRGIFLARQNSCSRRAIDNTLSVERAGRKPHVPCGALLRPSQLLLGRHATIFNSTLPAWATCAIPPAAGAIRTMPEFVKDVNGCIFPFVGNFFGFPQADKHVVKSSDELGVVDFQQLRRNRIWPHRHFPIRHAPNYPRHLVHGWFISKR